VGDDGSGDGGQGAAPSLSQSAGHKFPMRCCPRVPPTSR
jgi:hypothetical protein